MPVLPIRTTKTVKLTAIIDGEVEVHTSFTAGDVEQMSKKGADSNIILPLKLLVKSWNLTNAEGVALQVNEENLKLLDIADVNCIVEGAGVNTKDFLGETKTPTGSK